MRITYQLELCSEKGLTVTVYTPVTLERRILKYMAVPVGTFQHFTPARK
jgi:hypothetical protein